MLPIDETTLQNNPKFALLHAHLTNNVLNANGSTKHHPAQKERDAVTDALKIARIRAARSHLLKKALDTLDLSSPPASTATSSKLKPPPATKQPTSLPAELIELIILLASHLTLDQLPPASQKLLESTTQWASLQSHLPTIGALISSHLQMQALALVRIHSPQTNASYLHRSIPKLSSSVNAQLDAILSQKLALETRRLALTSRTTTLLSLHHLAHTLTILLLEQTKHGLLSRHIKAKTDFLALSAQQLEYAATEKRVKGERAVYNEQVKNALREYWRTLKDGMERLRERKDTAERILWGYGVGREDRDKEKVMREIARVYKELQKEIAEVTRDVERLRGR